MLEQQVHKLKQTFRLSFVKVLFQCRIATRIMVQLSVYLKKERELHEIAYSKTFNFI